MCLLSAGAADSRDCEIRPAESWRDRIRRQNMIGYLSPTGVLSSLRLCRVRSQKSPLPTRVVVGGIGGSGVDNECW